MYTLPLRLPPGEDLRHSLERFLLDRDLSAAHVLGAVGSLGRARLRLPGAAEPEQLQGDLTLLTLSGTLSPDGAQLHMTLADSQGRVLGGQVCSGCIVRTTLEALVLALPQHRLRREPDAATGQKELVVLPGAMAQEVLDFWFGKPGSPPHGEVRNVWFRQDPVFDAEVMRRFRPHIEAALRGALREWDATTRGTLGRILLLDQMTRNAFRSTPRAFEGDAQALEAARALVRRGADRSLNTVERWFVYMPFQHAEDLACQDESVRLFTRLAADSPAMAEALDYAHRHRRVIERFGRFPHRNEILGRSSTEEELAFLQQPGSRF